MEEAKVLYTFDFLGLKLKLTDQCLHSLIIQWTIMALLIIVAVILTRNLKSKPDKKQTVVEMLITWIRDLVDNNMGKEYRKFIPFIGTIGVYLILLNMVGIFAIKPPTANLSTTLGLALISFTVVNGYAMKSNGMTGYLKGLAHPMAFMLPLNIMERGIYLFTLTLRLFGNILVGTIIIELVYDALCGVGSSLIGNLGFVFGLGIPIPLHFFFDLFDGAIQTFIFMMLTMANIKMINEE